MPPNQPPPPRPGLAAAADPWEAIIIGGGLAGLSAGIYLGRALRRTLLIEDGRSLALWEPEVQNYLGFPDGVGGEDLLRRGRAQAERYNVEFAQDTIEMAERADGLFLLRGREGTYRSRRVLLATGLYHLPPDIPGVDQCLGQSMFFCKDCDAHRVQGRRIAIIGRNNEAIEYALGMLGYSACVVIATNGKPSRWDAQHAAWVKEYQIPVFPERIVEVQHERGKVQALTFASRSCFAVDSIFTTRGDVYRNAIAQGLGAEVDEEGQVLVDADLRTSVPGFYAAGCVTPANCQMIVAAGQGAAAAQAINRNLFEESLRNHSLRRVREQQLETEQTMPNVLQ